MQYYHLSPGYPGVRLAVLHLEIRRSITTITNQIWLFGALTSHILQLGFQKMGQPMRTTIEDQHCLAADDPPLCLLGRSERLWSFITGVRSSQIMFVSPVLTQSQMFVWVAVQLSLAFAASLTSFHLDEQSFNEECASIFHHNLEQQKKPHFHPFL